jgi:hypothetical protein
MNLNKTPASTFQRDSELIRQTVVRPSRHPPPRATREATRPPSPASPSLLRLAAARAAVGKAVWQQGRQGLSTPSNTHRQSRMAARTAGPFYHVQHLAAGALTGNERKYGDGLCVLQVL